MCSFLVNFYTANIYSQITVGFATQPKSVLSTVKLQSLAVQTTVIDFEEYSYSLSDVFGYNMCSKITVGFATQLKAVPSTVKIFAVYGNLVGFQLAGLPYLRINILPKSYDCLRKAARLIINILVSRTQ